MNIARFFGGRGGVNGWEDGGGGTIFAVNIVTTITGCMIEFKRF